MRVALLSLVLVGVALLAGCAAGGSRDDDGDLLETPDSMRTGRTSVSGAGRASSAGSGSAASVTFEVGGSDAERAAAEQLVIPLQSPAFDAGVLYAMAYVPSSSGVETERANSLAQLYADARPGYALYTFVLGGPAGPRSEAEVAAYHELLRVIETYVLGEPGASATGPDGHGFLVQVDPAMGSEPNGAELAQRAQPGLSLQMQAALARQLRVFGHIELADRLEQSTGPFLVTSLRPALIPMSEQVPLLIIDLHDLGPEYMYSLIDAYDRPIPGDLRGQPESLAAIGRRVQGMFPNRRLDSGAKPPPSGAWIWLVGEPGRSIASSSASF